MVLREGGSRAGTVRVKEAGNDGMATAQSTPFQGGGMQDMEDYYHMAML